MMIDEQSCYFVSHLVQREFIVDSVLLYQLDSVSWPASDRVTV
jgi:hypothetical protein